MNHTNISTFLTIASCESLSKAAELLYITQPALSHRLSSLENELGAALIIRQKGVRTIELTDAGRRFLPIAEKWQELWQETQEINLAAPVTPFRIANVDSLNEYFMPQVYTDFFKNNTNCKISISTLHSNAAYHAIENHEIDMALVTNPHFFKKVSTIPLFNESMKFVCSKTAPYQDAVSPSDLKVTNEIYIPWGNSFLIWHNYWFGNNSDIRMSIDNMGLFEQFLQLEGAWAIVPSTVAYTLLQKNLFKVCNLTDGPDFRTCYVINNNQHSESLLEQAFIDTLLRIVSTYPDVEIIKHPNKARFSS